MIKTSSEILQKKVKRNSKKLFFFSRTSNKTLKQIQLFDDLKNIFSAKLVY